MALQILGGGVSQFIKLKDTPSSYSGQAGKYVRVKTSEDGLEFEEVSTEDVFRLNYITVPFQPILGINYTKDAGVAVENIGNITRMYSTTSDTGTAEWWLYFISKGYDKEAKVSFCLPYVKSNAGISIYIYTLCNKKVSLTPDYYIGIKISGTTVYFVSKDGTTETSVDITTDFGNLTGSFEKRFFVIHYMPTQYAKLYKNGTLIATITTNLPPDTDTTTIWFPLIIYYNDSSSINDASLYFSSGMFRVAV